MFKNHPIGILIGELKPRKPAWNLVNISDERKNNISVKPIDISTIAKFLSSENIFIIEARLHRPSLEDAFVKLTGIEIALMKKDKEKSCEDLFLNFYIKRIG